MPKESVGVECGEVLVEVRRLYHEGYFSVYNSLLLRKERGLVREVVGEPGQQGAELLRDFFDAGVELGELEGPALNGLELFLLVGLSLLLGLFPCPLFLGLFL